MHDLTAGIEQHGTVLIVGVNHRVAIGIRGPASYAMVPHGVLTQNSRAQKQEGKQETVHGKDVIQ